MSETSEEDCAESIAGRMSRLNQILMGRSATVKKTLVSRDGLLDALFALFNECSNASLMKNQYVSTFVKKYDSTIKELKKLRIGITDFEVKTIIGRGHFGEVQVVREKSSGDVYALKVLRKADTLAQQNVAFYEEERDIMAKSQSIWLTQLQYAFQDKDNLYLIMEFHPGGDLLSLLSRFDDTFEEDMARFYLAEMLLAIHALHTMGYVHRDVKPENVLIDRTGHVKLADFGSACKISDARASVANMPVGTPDYICPEVLMRMNSEQTYGKFGEECDWWSLGICAYEMLLGKTPFTDPAGSMVVTYANIMNYQKCLAFPEEASLSSKATKLIRQLLSEPDDRLRYEQICVHPFFANLDLDNIRHTRPPFIPTVTSNDDVSNFDEFEKATPTPRTDNLKTATGFSGKDLPFIGFTFTKDLANPLFERTVLLSTSSEVSSPAGKASLERRLAQKSSELAELRERSKELQHKNSQLQSQVDELEKRLEDRNSVFHNLESERDSLERSIVNYTTDIKKLQRMLDLERQERMNVDEKAMRLLEEIRSQTSVTRGLQDDDLQNKLLEQEEVISLLEGDRNLLQEKIRKLEQDAVFAKEMFDRKDKLLHDYKDKLKETRTAKKMSLDESATEISELQKKFERRERTLQEKIDQLMEENDEVMKELRRLKEDKTDLESELYESRIQQDDQETLKHRLSDTEERCRSLESKVQRLSLVGKREDHLKQELKEKSQHVCQLAERIAELEERLRNSEDEYKKHEKLYTQREEQLREKIMELELNCDRIQSERGELEEQSLLAFEENENRLERISEQENIIASLKHNIGLLEHQVDELRDDLEKAALEGRSVRVRSRSRSASRSRSVPKTVTFAETQTTPRSSSPRRSRRSGYCQTETPRRSSQKSKSPLGRSVVITTSTDTQTTPRSYSPTRSPVRTYRESSPPGYRKFSPSKRVQTVSTEKITRASHTQTDEPSTRTRTAQTVSPPRRTWYSQTTTETSPTRQSRSPTRHSRSPTRRVTTQSSPKRSITIKKSPTRKITQTVKSDRRRSGSMQAEVNVSVSVNCDDTTSSESSTDTTLDTGAGDASISRRARSPLSKSVETSKPTAKTKVVFNPPSYKSRYEVALQDKERCRRKSESLADLKQENAYLELKVENLERELKEMREGTQQQRIRALDLKHELRERTSDLEKQLNEMRERAHKAELSQSEAIETANQLRDKEKLLKEKVDKIQAELDKIRIESRRNLSTLQEERDELDVQVKSLSSKVASLASVDEDLKKANRQVSELLPKNKSMEADLKRLQSEKTTLKMQLERVQAELKEKNSDCDELEQKLEMLKGLCAEMEVQISDYEILSGQFQDKAKNWTSDKSVYEKAVDERDMEVQSINQQLNIEKAARNRAENIVKDLKRQMQTIRTAYESEIDSLKQRLSKYKDKSKSLSDQLADLEKAQSLLEVDKKSLTRQIEALKEENIKLKEEATKLITSVGEIKASNLKLSKNLEDAMDRYEMLASIKTDLENQLESILADHRHEKYKTEATMSQQTKLIDYLQCKVETAPKKKKGIFGGGKPTDMSSIRMREMQHSLEHERQKNNIFKQQIAQLKEELHTLNVLGSGQKASKTSLQASNTLALSPMSQPSTMQTPQHSYKATMGTPKSQPSSASATPSSTFRKPIKERMHHNIPHRFLTGLNSRPAKCAVCLGTVHFVKQATKCIECNIVCHPVCAVSMPSSCGLPTEYIQHFNDVMSKARVKSSTNISLSAANLKLQLQAWMKVPRPGKKLWEKKYVVLENNCVKVYNNEDRLNPFTEPFELCPHNAHVTVHSAVTAAELNNTASSDLPYIFKLDSEPHTTCWPGRILYLMANTFSDKQKWIATLEAIVDYSGIDTKRQDAKLIGNTILSVAGDRKNEFNSTLLFKDNIVLVGSDMCLYWMDVSSKSPKLNLIKGFGPVYQIESLPGLDIVAFLTEEKRQVALVSATKLRGALSSGRQVSLVPLEDCSFCITFTLGKSGDEYYLCAALNERIVIYKYSQDHAAFHLIYETPTSEACSCMYFGGHYILAGTDKFHKIEAQSWTMTEFLDSTDSSLAYVALGASHYNSFPIAVLQVSAPGKSVEFLLCYHEFGVFVTEAGRRSREDDMKWAGLPLAFAYREPYLYVFHFNAMQVVNIPANRGDVKSSDKTLLNIASPRYLGPAISPGAIYIASFQESVAEILCFRGNMVSNSKENDDPQIYAKPLKKSQSRDKVETDVKVRVDMHAEESDSDATLITSLSHSPGRNTTRTSIKKLAHSPGASRRQVGGTPSASRTQGSTFHSPGPARHHTGTSSPHRLKDAESVTSTESYASSSSASDQPTPLSIKERRRLLMQQLAGNNKKC